MHGAGDAAASTSSLQGRRLVVSRFATLDRQVVGENEDASWVIQGFDR